MIKKQKNNKFHGFIVLSLFAGCFIPTSNCFAHGSEDMHRQKNQNKFSMSGDIKGSITYSDNGSDTDYLTRLRLQLETKLTEDFQLVGRINTTKLYSSESSDDDDFLVDRLYFSWNNIGKTAFNLSGGRLPTTGENSPSYFRLGLDKPDGTLSSFADTALDGVTLGYRYQNPLPGKFSLYYASQFEIGYESNENNSGLGDTNIYGVKWDIYQKNDRSISLQSFLFSDIRNIPEHVTITVLSTILPRVTLGDIYHTNFTYLDNFQKFNFFVNLGWSHTNPKAIDDLGASLLSSWWEQPSNEDGFCIYVGGRYNLDSLHSKIGLEFNHGSKYWVNFSQDAQIQKLATRGSVAEAYWTFEPPIPSALSKWTESIIGRIGYQYYDYKYTGSGYWLGSPIKIDSIKNDPMGILFYNPVDAEYKIYAAVEMYF